MTASCGNSAAETAPKELDALSFHSVGWTVESDGERTMSKAAFSAAARSAFHGVAVRRLRVRRATLSGEMEVFEGQGALALEVRIDTERIPFPLSATLAATGAIAGKRGEGALVAQGLGDLAMAVREMIRVAEGDQQAWISALGSAEPDVQILGARLLGVHRVEAALDPLAALLTDPREAVAEAAAGALSRIGDERAVPLLIKSIRRGDVRSEVRVIEAIGHIGGAEAEAYLEMTAIGHELKEVRRISSELLGRLRKQEKRP